MSSLGAGLKPLAVAPQLGVAQPSRWGLVRVPGLRWVDMKMAQAPYPSSWKSQLQLRPIPPTYTYTKKPCPPREQIEAG